MKFKKLLSKNLTELTNKAFRVALADEGQVVPPTEPTQPVEPQTTAPTQATATAPTINYEQLIAQARQEEKQKLYPEITKLKAEKEAQTKRINELIIQVAEKDETIKAKDAEIAKASSKKQDSEEVKNLKLKIEELTNSVALKDSELAELKLSTYKEAKMREVQDQIIPELVRGTTPEEIDASIEIAKQAFASVVSRVSSAQPTAQPQQVMPTANPVMPVVNPTVNPVSNTGIDISSLAGTSLFDKAGREQYKQLRTQLQL